MVLSDADLAAGGSYAGLTLTLARQGGANPDDRFSAATGGSVGALTEGAALIYGGAALGTVTMNSGGTLGLSFSAGTAVQVNGILRAIAYTNASDAPPASVVLGWSASDGNAGARGSGGAKTASGQTTVAITAVIDAPVVTTSSGASPAGATAVLVDGGLSLSDVDNATLAHSDDVDHTGFASSQDVLAFVNDGSTMGDIEGQLRRGLRDLDPDLVRFERDGRTVPGGLAGGHLPEYRLHSDHRPRTVSITANDGTSQGWRRPVDRSHRVRPDAVRRRARGHGVTTRCELAGRQRRLRGRRRQRPRQRPTGNDSLTGNEGNDTLYGNEGNDN